MKIKKRTLRFIEFLFVGLFMGVLEDALAVYFVTGESITFHTVWIVFLVALPFAFLSEYVVDHPRFWESVLKIKKDTD